MSVVAPALASVLVPGCMSIHQAKFKFPFFMSGKIVAAATLAVVPACCCYYFAQFSDPTSPPDIGRKMFENACQPCERSEQREAASSEARTWSQHMELKPPLTASHLLNHPQSRLRLRRQRRRRSSPSTRHITMQALPGSLATFSTISTFYLTTPKVSTALQRRR